VNVIRSCWYKRPVGEKCTNKGVEESKVVEKIQEMVREYRGELVTAINKGEGGDIAKERGNIKRDCTYRKSYKRKKQIIESYGCL